MRSVILIAHNLRSAHNVGSLLRTAEGLGIAQVFLTGYSPYPKLKDDPRLPHEISKTHHQIHKTALGTELLLDINHTDNINQLIKNLKNEGYEICALEQAPSSVSLPNFLPKSKVVLIVGREVEGIESEVLKQADVILEIPMLGQKESFNVAQAAAMALYQIVNVT